jgi:hypothetical protein
MSNKVHLAKERDNISKKELECLPTRGELAQKEQARILRQAIMMLSKE